MDLTTGQNLIKEKRYPEALKYFLNILDIDSNNLELNFFLGRVYSELLDFKKSEKFYKKTLEINKNSIGCLINLAILYQNIGDKKNSIDNFKKVIKINKNYIYAYYGLYTIDPNLITENEFNHLKDLLNNNKINLKDKSLIYFLLSKKEKNNNNLKEEIKFLKNYHKYSFESNIVYNKQSEFYYNNILGKFNHKINFINIDEFDNNFKPIFIVGLPRSGSTLVESILTSGKKKIKSFGESNFFNIAILDQIKNKIFNNNFDLNNFEYKIDLSLVKKSILSRYNFQNLNNKEDIVFIDKSLENVFNIDVIVKIFPSARFIHTSRDIKDSILSIYFSMLPELSWTHSLKTIDSYISNYKKTIIHFKNKYPNKLLNINLDNLTANSDETTKQIFDFCRLEWSKETLDFHLRKDLFSKTLSSTQIRRKISPKNQSIYKNYYYLLT